MTVAARLRRYRVECAWVAFAIANYAAMVVWPSRYAIPCHLVWISLVLLYALRVWSVRWTVAALAFVIGADFVALSLDAVRGRPEWDALIEVVPMTRCS